jgi:transcriptional regulator with XRE-family HTH domain
MKFGANLRKWRKKLNLTQAQLAEAVDLNRNMIHFYEVGRHVPKIDEFLKIYEFLRDNIKDRDLKIGELLGVDENSP